MKRLLVSVIIASLFVLPACAGALEPSEQHPLPPFGENIPDEYALVYEQDFSPDNALDDFEMSDPDTWRKDEKDGEHFLDLVKGVGKYTPEVRSPHSIALLKPYLVRDFILEMDVESTDIHNGAHRDVCFFFNAENPSHFYYVHIASAADPNAHNIFLVNGAPRANIAEQTTKGVDWGVAIRHRVRIERTCDNGKIRVFFNDMETPIMEAADTHFGLGRVGFGSFDNICRFYEMRLYAPETVENNEAFFN